MHFLGCLLGLLLGIFILALNLGFRLWWSIRNLFQGGGRQGGSTYRNSGTYGSSGSYGSSGNTGTSGQSAGNGSQTHSSSTSAHGKVFADNEGEYVDFEEVKE